MKQRFVAARFPRPERWWAGGWSPSGSSSGPAASIGCTTAPFHPQRRSGWTKACSTRDRRHRAPDPGTLATRAALASVAVALLLLMLKSHAAWATGSVAMLGSLADTMLDLVASLVTLFGVRVAAVPADRDHRFGHGKAEALAALFQVVLIAVSAAGILWRAIERLIENQVTTEAGEGILVSAIAIAATLALLVYQRRVIASTGSVAIETDHVHYQSDLLLNLSVIAALALEQYLHLGGADAIFGIAIALWLAWGAWKASSRAIDH